MKATLLGTASGLPASDRFGQTIVLTPEDEADSFFILDSGDGASSLLMRHGFDHRNLRGIFISHMHADHHGGFAQVVKTCMHLNKADDLVVLAPEEGIAPLRAYLDASYLFPQLLGFPIRWVSLAECVGQRIALPGGIALEVYPNAHLAWFRERVGQMDAPPRPCTFESYSAVFAQNGHRVIYSGNLHGPKGSD